MLFLGSQASETCLPFFEGRPDDPGINFRFFLQPSSATSHMAVHCRQEPALGTDGSVLLWLLQKRPSVPVWGKFADHSLDNSCPHLFPPEVLLCLVGSMVAILSTPAHSPALTDQLPIL